MSARMAALGSSPYSPTMSIADAKFSRSVVCRTYYSCVVFVALFQAAAKEDTDYCCYVAKVFCLIEGVSILGNILKWHGYNVNGKELLTVLCRRAFGGEKDDY